MEGQHLWAMGSSHFIGNEVNYFDKVAWLFVVVSHLLPLCHFKSHVCKPIPPISKWGGLGFRGRYRGSLNSKDICTKNMLFKTERHMNQKQKTLIALLRNCTVCINTFLGPSVFSCSWIPIPLLSRLPNFWIEFTVFHPQLIQKIFKLGNWHLESDLVSDN